MKVVSSSQELNLSDEENVLFIFDNF
jgi:hypothetical protein